MKGFCSSAPSMQAGDLVAAEIKGSNNQRMRRDLLGHSPVSLVLLLLRRQRRAIQVKKFGPIKADALGAILRHGVNVIRQFDVRRKNNVPPVACR